MVQTPSEGSPTLGSAARVPVTDLRAETVDETAERLVRELTDELASGADSTTILDAHREDLERDGFREALDTMAGTDQEALVELIAAEAAGGG